ncbi:MAG: PstS family phosphate ABC transporter substrate-binding protein [Planctomycetaceae bacterium]
MSVASRVVGNWGTAVLLAFSAFLSAGCSVESVDAPAAKTGGETAGATESAAGGEKRIQVDGSSTVAKVAAAVQEEFTKKFADTKVALKVTGTGTGFKEMIAGRIDIANASRPVKDSEKADCEKAGIELVELKIALDGLTVCVNRENDWLDTITVAQLKKIWAPGSTVKTWKDVDPAWPDVPLALFGPGEESGTFDYFTEVINGKEDQITENYSASADDNVTITGIAGEKGGMGFFGCAYYFSNRDKVKVLKISATDSVADGIEPTVETVRSGAYKPLSRPLFIYVKKSSLAKPEVLDFAKYFLNEGQSQVSTVGYVPLEEAELATVNAALDAAVSGAGK